MSLLKIVLIISGSITNPANTAVAAIRLALTLGFSIVSNLLATSRNRIICSSLLVNIANGNNPPFFKKPLKIVPKDELPDNDEWFLRVESYLDKPMPIWLVSGKSQPGAWF